MQVLGSSCGSMGRVVASDNRDLRFESSHKQILFSNKLKLYLKDENMEKEAWNSPIFKEVH